MQALLPARVALLLALRDGPGYGRDLIRRVGAAARGAIRLSPARVYGALDALRRAGLLEARRVSPGGSRGARSRTYYELTPAGVLVSSQQRQALLGVLAGRPLERPDAAERSRMASRVAAAEELSLLGRDLERSGRRL